MLGITEHDTFKYFPWFAGFSYLVIPLVSWMWVNKYPEKGHNHLLQSQVSDMPNGVLKQHYDKRNGHAIAADSLRGDFDRYTGQILPLL